MSLDQRVAARSFVVDRVAGSEASAVEAKAFAGEIKAELEKRGLLGEKLGLGSFDGTAREALVNAGVKNIVDTRNLMLEARMVKNQDEISCLKTCAAMVDGVWFRVWENLKPGMRDTDLMTLGSSAGYELGLEAAVPGGWRTGPMTFDRGCHATSRIIQVGDLVYGSYCGATYMGYGSCTYRTFIVGREPTAKEKDWYKQCASASTRLSVKLSREKRRPTRRSIFPRREVGIQERSRDPRQRDRPWHRSWAPARATICRSLTALWSFDHPQVFEEGMTIAVESGKGKRAWAA